MAFENEFLYVIIIKTSFKYYILSYKLNLATFFTQFYSQTICDRITVMTGINRLTLTKDKGYSWVIVLGSFLSHFASVGFAFGTAGNLTIAHQDFFKVDLQQGSLIGTVHVGVLFIFGK